MSIYPTTISRTLRSSLNPSSDSPPRRDGLVLDWSIPSTPTAKTPVVKSAGTNNEESGFAKIDFTSTVSMVGKGSIRGQTYNRDATGVENRHHAKKHHPKRHLNLQLKEPIREFPYLSSVSPGFDCDSSPLASSTSTPSLTSSIRTVSDVDVDSLDIHWKSLEIAQTRWKGMQDIVDECNEFLSFLTLSPIEPSSSVEGRMSTSSNESISLGRVPAPEENTYLPRDVHPAGQSFVDSALENANPSPSDRKVPISPQKQTTARGAPSLVMSAIPTITSNLQYSDPQQPSLGTVRTSSATWSILDLYGDDEDSSKPDSTDTVIRDLISDSQSADILSVLPRSPEHANRSLRKYSSISSMPSFALDVPFPDAATLAQRKRKSSAPVTRHPVSSSIASPSCAGNCLTKKGISLPSVSLYSQNNSSTLSSSAIRRRDSLAQVPVHRKGPSSNSAAAKPAVEGHVKSSSSSSFRSTVFQPLLSDVATIAKGWSGRRKSLNAELKSSSSPAKMPSTNMVEPEPLLPFPMRAGSKTDSIRAVITTVATVPQKGSSDSELSSTTKRRSILKSPSQVVVPPTDSSRRPGRVRASSDVPPMVSVPILSPGRSPPSRRKSAMFKTTSSRSKNTPITHSPDSSTRDNPGHSRILRIPEDSCSIPSSITDSSATLPLSTKSSATLSGRRHTHTHFIDANAVPFPHPSILAQRIIRSPPPPSRAELDLLPSSSNYVPPQDRIPVTGSSIGSETRARLSLTSPPSMTNRNHSPDNLVGTGSPRDISTRISAPPKSHAYAAARASVSTGAF